MKQARKKENTDKKGRKKINWKQRFRSFEYSLEEHLEKHEIQV